MNNNPIAIPPFPSQDLAKLVLGYLAEEQLMTAYDEFLQASPYLDALQNEYDRIFMTSLKNILAEYRAVKIYVETCKPFTLRRKLFQCTNLLEIVKFLINNVDIDKLYEGSVDKTGCTRHSLSKSICDVCNSLKLSNCICRSSQSTSQIEATSLEESVETTSLADLPGNTSYKKRIVPEAEPENILHSITSSDQIKEGRSIKHIKCSENLKSTTFGCSPTDNEISSGTERKSPLNSSFLVNDPGINDVLNIVTNDTKDVSAQKEYNEFENSTNMVGVTVLQDFSAESDSSSINKVIVPDSSTSENIVLQTSTTETGKVTNSIDISKCSARPPPLLIKIGNEHKHFNLQPKNLHSLPRLAIKDSLAKSSKRKVEEQNSPKITILSDVKVDNDLNMPPLLKNTTSSSLVQMQTLYINGTPAYKNTQQAKQRFTKDEIMAMPTIIIVPSSDKTKKIVPTVTQNDMMINTSNTEKCSTGQILEPLVIDISSNDDISCQDDKTSTDNCLKNSDKQINDNRLVKTVDISHASLPKDNTLGGLKASTPHVLPPARKSSSTPRRTSHVRVLDFTTPRRILHETLNEQEVNQCSEEVKDDSHGQDSNATAINNNNFKNSTPVVNNTGKVNSSEDIHVTNKHNKTTVKLYNWDSDLRALAYAGNGNVQKSKPIQKSKPKKHKRKVSPTNKSTNTRHSKSENTIASDTNDKTEVTKKIRSTKTRKKSTEVDKSVNEKQELTASIIKPTINIISRNKWTDPIEIEKSQKKSSNVDDNIDTPELERLSLQNEIGVKLNISDLLETPYKQALYDIQMETPKFLGPDILGDPLSDIKIMNIPTPRFFNTPKLNQNTPSSYSSRPTDYSSGGSYYKPDDQDYVLGNEIIEDTPAVSQEISKLNKDPKTINTENVKVNKRCEGKSRPVRKCTKNVSYNYTTPSSSRLKDVDEKTEKSSTCSETSMNKLEKKIDKCKISKIDKDNVVEKKRESKKKSKKYKSPVKKDSPKTFMKIKPRRTTPVKEILGKGRKKTNELNQMVYIKPQPKKVIVGKEKNVCFSPLTVSPVPTKSRRKSSTPRKLHCSKRLNSESSSINSPERKKQLSQCKASQITHLDTFGTQNSEGEQISLQWSDDGFEESKVITTGEKTHSPNESDDISRIKEYIKTTIPNEIGNRNEVEGTLQVDLIKRGFDVETARMIERDLLETPTHSSSNKTIPIQSISQPTSSLSSNEKQNEPESKILDKSVESDCSTSVNLQIVQDDNDTDNYEFDLSVQECNEDTNNYFVYKYDEAKFIPSNQVKLKEAFSMEICVENDIEIRLRAMPFKTVFEHESYENPDKCNTKRIEKPPSPFQYDTLFTPRKAQCYEIFDSTLTSLDTPLKYDSPKKEIETVTEIILEVEKLETETEIKPKLDTKKRKRVQSGTNEESSNGSKRGKPDTSYLLNSAGIQNIDIESVLSKLHGP